MTNFKNDKFFSDKFFSKVPLLKWFISKIRFFKNIFWQVINSWDDQLWGHPFYEVIICIINCSNNIICSKNLLVLIYYYLNITKKDTISAIAKTHELGFLVNQSQDREFRSKIDFLASKEHGFSLSTFEFFSNFGFTPICANAIWPDSFIIKIIRITKLYSTVHV